MTMRASFEAEMRRANPCVRLARQKNTTGEYRTVTVERAWKLWVASWQLATYEATSALRAAGLTLLRTDRGLVVEKLIHAVAQPASEVTQ